MLTSFLNALSIAFSELSRNITRTALTSLGIMIGVGAVIIMVGLGQGATESIENDLSSMGSNLLIISPGTGGGPHASTPAPNFTNADITAIKSQVPYLRAVAPITSAPGTAVHQDRSWETTIHGTTNDWLVAMDFDVESGRHFTDGELRSGAGVCLVGDSVRSELFGSSNGLGEEIRFERATCMVVGTLSAKGENTMGMDQDNLIIAPMPMVQRRMLGSTDINSIYISAESAESMPVVSEQLTLLLSERRHVVSESTVNFEVTDTREMADMVSGITGVLTMFLAAVAGVSLLVGGIGIMNIMLVSVTERTREIGIRMAIGALEADVMTQFLVESVVLSVFGGIMGVIIGLLGTWGGAALMGIPVIINFASVVVAVGFSALMGVVFGWVPARRAARLEPIDALRSM